ncbi:hypothetical protein [Anditalea andensis]|uniref:hypothetical protein n=1 Tax=Anditalea andensis TaxID=1048983 RepID=UPI0013DF2571|nr:hypothetical protein [Anditalea andensis]
MGCTHRWGMAPFQGWGSMVTIFERWDESIAGVWCPFRAGIGDVIFERWDATIAGVWRPFRAGIGDCGF